MGNKVSVHIVTYQDETSLEACLDSLHQQEIFSELIIEVTHNGQAGLSDVKRAVEKFDGISFFHNKENLGFCAAHNQGVARFLAQKESDFLLVLNADIALERELIQKLREGASQDPQIGITSPLLLRADSDLNPIEPKIIDSAGITFTPTLRHFDRYALKLLSSMDIVVEDVGGATGACMFFTKECVRDLVFQETESQTRFAKALQRVYPALRESHVKRAELFDEAFFAYREDAELSLRARSYGWRILFIPSAVAYHIRQVTSKNRATSSAEINAHSVKNRFLLQAMHFSILRDYLCIIPGFIFRNLLVLGGVALRERSSYQGVLEFFTLFSRAWGRRREISSKRKITESLWK